MSVRLNAEKRRKIMYYIDMFLTDAELQAKYCKVLQKVKDIVALEILERFPQNEMKVLEKYGLVKFGWSEYSIWFEDNRYYSKGEIYDLPLYYPSNCSLILSVKPKNEQLFEEFKSVRKEYFNKLESLHREYEKFVYATYSLEGVIDVIPWLQTYYSEIVKESFCKLNEDTVKNILKNESKRSLTEA